MSVCLPVCGSAGKSVTLLLSEKDDLTGTGKNPRRKRASDTISHMRHNKANTDELSFMMKSNNSHYTNTENCPACSLLSALSLTAIYRHFEQTRH